MSTKTRTGEKRNAVQFLSFDVRTAKRATYEAFEFTVVGPHQVEVTNASYGGEKDEHSYLVGVEKRGGLAVPAECNCPADIHREPDCKHKVALATVAGPTVMNAAVNYENATPEPAAGLTADGGDVPAKTHSEEDACPNGDPRCEGPNGDELPCFPCYYREEGDWRPTPNGSAQP